MKTPPLHTSSIPCTHERSKQQRCGREAQSSLIGSFAEGRWYVCVCVCVCVAPDLEIILVRVEARDFWAKTADQQNLFKKYRWDY